jgi:hypothetical protein
MLCWRNLNDRLGLQSSWKETPSMSKKMPQMMLQTTPDQHVLLNGAVAVVARDGAFSFKLAAARPITQTMLPIAAFVDGISVPIRRRCSS